MSFGSTCLPCNPFLVNGRHKCPTAVQTDAYRQELANASAIIARYKREVESLSLRIHQADVKTQEAEVANSRSAAEVKRLTDALAQERQDMETDLKTSETHGMMLNRRLAKIVTELALAQTENEDLRKNSDNKGALSVS